MRSWKSVLLGGLAAALVSGAAAAVPLDLEGFTSGQSFWISDGGVTRQVGAVEFHGDQGGQAGVAYCIDLHQPPELGLEQYTVLDLSLVPGGLAGAWLLKTYGPGSLAANPGVAITALQIALWEVSTDPSFDLDAGSFRLLSVTQAARTLAQQYLDALPVQILPADVAGVIGLGHATYQDQLFLPGVVPEPATALMLGAGLLGLARLGRRRV